jgi:hypothetical protein
VVEIRLFNWVAGAARAGPSGSILSLRLHLPAADTQEFECVAPQPNMPIGHGAFVAEQLVCPA